MSFSSKSFLYIIVSVSDIKSFLFSCFNSFPILFRDAFKASYNSSIYNE